MNILRAIQYLIVVVRPHNCLIASGSVAIGAFLAAHTLSTRSAAASVMAFLVCAGAYALNDLFDIDSDRIAKPWRPLANGRLKAGTVVELAVSLWVAAALVSLLAGPATLAFFFAWALLLWLYSWKLKTRGLPGHILVSLIASSGFILGGITGGRVGVTVLPFAIALLFHLAREIVKSVVDAKGDRLAGVTTLAVRIGEQKALALSLWFIAGVIIVSFLPFALRVYGYLYMLPVAAVIYPLLGLCICLIVRARGGSARIEQASQAVARALKLAMPVGLFAFFMAGI